MKEKVTIEAKKDFEDLINNRTHDLLDEPCGCPACEYSQYTKKSKPKYGKLLFYLSWLIHQVKMDYLKKNGKAKETINQDRKAWILDEGEYEKAPFLKETKRILKKLRLELEGTVFEELIGSLIANYYVYRQRVNEEKFLKLKETLFRERLLNWGKGRKRKNDIFVLLPRAQKAADIIFKEKEITQRELIRRTKINKKDLESIWNHLRKNYGVEIQTGKGYKGKTVIYRWTRKSSKGRYWTIGVK